MIKVHYITTGQIVDCTVNYQCKLIIDGKNIDNK